MRTTATQLLCCTLGILASVALCAPASAALGGNEIQINSSSGTMKEPRVAMASDGGFVAVWVEDVAEDVLARMFDSSGNPTGNDFTVSTGGGPHKKPDVSIAGDGSFVVVWEKENGEDDKTIYARRYNSSGSPQGGKFQVNTSTGELKEPSVSSKSDGSFVVVWGLEAGENDADVWSRRYDSSGNPLSGETQVNTSSGEHKKPSIATASDGSFAVVWEQKVNDNVTDLLAQRYNSSGSPVGGEIQLNASSDKHEKPRIGMASDGSFVVAWTRETGENDKDVIARRFNSSGAPLGGELQINTSGGEQSNPSIGVASDGSFTVVWEDKTWTDILGREYDASGNPLGAEFTVNTTTTGEQKKPWIGMNADGGAVAVWENDGTTDIFASWSSSAQSVVVISWEEISPQ